MILRRRTRRRLAEAELQEAKRRTSVSRLRAQREYRTSVERLAESQRVAFSLSSQNSSLERSTATRPFVR